jgi:L-methionine (R)-S-oxide reductase
LSVSEIVVPVIRHNEVQAVLDVDSEKYGMFNEEDQIYLEKLVAAITWNKNEK